MQHLIKALLIATLQVCYTLCDIRLNFIHLAAAVEHQSPTSPALDHILFWGEMTANCHISSTALHYHVKRTKIT